MLWPKPVPDACRPDGCFAFNWDDFQIISHAGIAGATGLNVEGSPARPCAGQLLQES